MIVSVWPALLLAPLCCLLAYGIGARELHGRWPARTRGLAIRATVAVATALLLALIGLPGDVLPSWLLGVLAGLLVAIAWLDLETQMLADRLTALLAALALLVLWHAHHTGYIGWLPQLGVGAGLLLLGWFCAGPYSRWRRRDMLGWGDVKFFAAAGLWLAPLQLPPFLIIAGGVGALAALGYKSKTGEVETPFAPALCLALFSVVVFGISL